MNEDHLIYELSDADRTALNEGLNEEASDEAKAKFDALREDVARLDGYLKGRADSDLPKFGEGIGMKRGPGANKDLS